MALEKCPSCGSESLIRTPRSKVMISSFGCDLHTADEHSMDCLNEKCKYTSGTIRINTEEGDRLELPWWKRIFS